MNIRKNNLNVQNLSFSGHKKALDKYGYEQHTFYYLYDSSKYNCEVELYNISKDKKGNFSIVEDSKSPALTLKMRDGGITEDLSQYDEINLENGFAYRFKLTNGKNVSYGFDNGTVLGIFDNNPDNKFNVVLNNRAIINKNGTMQLIMPDEYYPGVDRAKDASGRYQVDKSKRKNVRKAVRTHANKLGGQFIGITKRLPELQAEGVKRIVGTPFTKDTISSHLYWTENAYQVAPGLGTENEFKELQVELFKNGINWIADAALVNEGFGGIHLSEVLRKGADGTCKNMFRSDERISLGILPDKAEEKGFTRMKMINAPFKLEGGSSIVPNPDYSVAKPTYVQFYDSRLASEEQKKSQSPSRLTTYDIKNTDNIFDITKHDDAVYPFPIEVSPSELERNIRREIANNGSVAVDKGYANTVKSVEAMKRITEFSNFNVVNKEKAGGLEVWDGNVDIAKLNFYRSKQDYSRFADIRPSDRQAAIEAFDRGTLAVRDYAVNSGKYWTQLAADTQLQYLSQYLAEHKSSDYMTTIKMAADNGSMPKSVRDVVDKEVVRNVQTGNYNLRRLNESDMRSELSSDPYSNDYRVYDYIQKKAMDLPLETLPVATNLLGILTSPYLAKKANTAEELGVSRFDLSSLDNPNLPNEYRKTYDQMDEVYSSISQKIDSIVSDIDGVKGEDGKVTDYGRYVISEITPDLTKFFILKALNPQAADIKVDAKGKFDFSNVNEESITMQSLGITYANMTSKEEAQIVVNALTKGLEENVSVEELLTLKEAVNNRFEKRSLDDFRIAEMIIDRTESGLGWRIDAAKDIASIDAVRSGVDSMENAWNNVIDFWKLYNQSVLKINPHAYTTAEITDLADLLKKGDSAVFADDADAERKFLEETGITAVANYNYFFSLLPDIYAPLLLEDFDDPSGWQAQKEENFRLLTRLDEGWGGNPGFLFQSPSDGVKNSYTFVGNHDKQRILHALSLDTSLYKTDFSADKKEHRASAAKVLQKDESSIVYDKLNSKAIAMGERLNTAFDAEIKDEKLLKALKASVAELASGTFKGKEFPAEAFGTRSIDVAIKSVFDQVEAKGTKIPDREEKEAKVLQSILVPAYDRFLSIYKLLTVLPGSPTDFAGDRVGVTGAEEKAKNYHQQNRNVIHWEWLNDDKDNPYSFVNGIYKQINEIASLRNKPELSALNDGDTVTIPVVDDVVEKQEAKEGEKATEKIKQNKNYKMQAILRYNDKGSVVLAITDSKGASSPLNKEMNREDGQKATRIYFDPSITTYKQGLKHGLAKDAVFVNARDEDDKYVISEAEHGYYLAKHDADGNEVPIQIKPDDLNTLILYREMK